MAKELKINSKIKNDLTFENLANEFLRKCSITGCTDSTIQKYAEIFHYFTKYFDEKNPISLINQRTIEDYTLYEKERGLKDSTINIRLSSLNTLFRFGHERGYMSRVYVLTIKTDEEIKETYTIPELEILLKKPNIKKCTFAQYRTWVIINFLLGTGCRAATLRNIKVEDVDFKNKEIIFKHSKNRRQHIIPLADALNEVLSEYIMIRDGKPSDWLFCSRTGVKMTKHCLTLSIITYNRKRGIDRTGIHAFRHTFAKLWIINGGDPFRLQKILGHSSFEMTRKYVNMFGQDLKQNFNEYNPLSAFERTSHISMAKFRK